MCAYEQRFPTHPWQPELLASSVVEHTVDEGRGVETFARLSTVKPDLPWIVRKAAGCDCMEFKSHVTI